MYMNREKVKNGWRGINSNWIEVELTHFLISTIPASSQNLNDQLKFCNVDL